MNPKSMKEILATHADQLVQGEHPHAEDFPDLSAEDQNEISPLLDVAEHAVIH